MAAPKAKPKVSSLEKEAKEFRRKRTPRKDPEETKEKALTARVYLAGQAMSGLLSTATGPIDTPYLRRESYRIADAFLEEE